MPLAISAAGAVLEYLERTQGEEKPFFDGISTYTVDGYVVLDANTRKNLELTETSRDRSFNGSLLWAIDQTETAMGSRMLRKWLLKPLLSVDIIKQRQTAIAELLQMGHRRDEIAKTIARLSDLERLAVRLSSGTINPRELAAVGASLAVLPELAALLDDVSSPYLNALRSIPQSISSLAVQLSQALVAEPPRELTEGGIFADGYNQELDEVRSLLGGGRDWIDEFQKTQQERTGIKSLKVNYNRSFGYYIEVSNANQSLVPADFIRKQTLTNAERYITPDLKEYEVKILNAEKNQSDLEYKLYLDLRKSLAQVGADVHKAANPATTASFEVSGYHLHATVNAHFGGGRAQTWLTPNGPVDAKIIYDNYSLGLGVVRFPSELVATVQVTGQTPVDEDYTDYFYTQASVREPGDTGDVPTGRAARFLALQQEVIKQDFFTWENMKYLEKPNLAPEEAHDYAALRRWAHRFYPGTQPSPSDFGYTADGAPDPAAAKA